MKKISLLITFFALLNSCSSQESKKMEFISYGHSLIPNYNYEKLTSNLLNTNLIDSLKVIGRPLTKNSVKFEIDTLRASQFNISLTKLRDKIKNFDLNKNRIEYMNIENRNGKKVPLESIVSMSIFLDYDKPEIFIPEPRYFLYKGKSAIKFEIYYQKKIEAKLDKIIREYTSEKGLKIEFIN